MKKSKKKSNVKVSDKYKVLLCEYHKLKEEMQELECINSQLIQILYDYYQLQRLKALDLM